MFFSLNKLFYLCLKTSFFLKRFSQNDKQDIFVVAHNSLDSLTNFKTRRQVFFSAPKQSKDTQSIKISTTDDCVAAVHSRSLYTFLPSYFSILANTNRINRNCAKFPIRNTNNMSTPNYVTLAFCHDNTTSYLATAALKNCRLKNFVKRGVQLKRN